VSTGAIQRVVVAVPTAGVRPLGELLDLLVAQARDQAVIVDIALLDNGSVPSEQVRDAARSPEVLVRHVASRGVASVRNAALDLAGELGADTLVFIDDDERPVEGWLRAHLDACARYDADVVLGPVPVRLPPDAPRWLDGGLVLRDVLANQTDVDGPYAGPVSAGNTLVRVDVVRRSGVRFDPAFDVSGGEDVVFFSRLRSHGANVVWASAAVAHEYQDADRLTFSGFLGLRYAQGQRVVLVERVLDGAVSPLRVAPRRLYRIGRGVVRALAGLLTGRRDDAARGLGDAAFGCGSLSALAGKRPSTYGS